MEFTLDVSITLQSSIMSLPYHANSLVAILISLEFAVQILCSIDRREFLPKPDVNVVFVHFHRYVKTQRPRSLISDDQRRLFRDFVTYGYTQWSPTVLEAFRAIFTRKQLSIVQKTQKLKGEKPTDLTLDRWIALFKTFRDYVDDRRKDIIRGSYEKLKSEQGRLDKVHRKRAGRDDNGSVF